jgi:hypothetical protein
MSRIAPCSALSRESPLELLDGSDADAVKLRELDDANAGLEIGDDGRGLVGWNGRAAEPHAAGTGASLAVATSASDRPTRSTLHAATTSNFRRALCARVSPPIFSRAIVVPVGLATMLAIAVLYVLLQRYL